MNINEKINFLTLIEILPKIKQHLYGRFRCDCGVEKSIRIKSVESENTKSCGCHRKKQAVINSKNVITHGDTGSKLYLKWVQLKSKNKLSETWFDYLSFKDWYNKNYIEGYYLRAINKQLKYSPENCYFSKTRTREKEIIKNPHVGTKIYKIWKRIIYKCTNKSYERYEGCELYKDWNIFENFLEWSKDKYKEGLLPKRIDKSKGYEPDNVKFISRKEMSIGFQDKVRKTSLERYGSEHASKLTYFKEKFRNTCIKKYGVDNPGKHIDVVKKREKTNLERYGVINTFQYDEFKKKIVETNIRKYGTPHPPTTNYEQETFGKYINSFGYKFEPNRMILSGKEIDYYNDELKLGFEYCGLYWHNEMSPSKRGKNYHYYKYRICREKNIKLITIFSDEWLSREEQVKGLIRSQLSKNDRVFARDCTIREIPSKEGQLFVKENHLQPQFKTPIYAVGLYYNDILLSSCSINKHHRDSTKYIIDRLCFKIGYSIVGGASKMIHYIKKYCTLNNINELITWSDNRWSNGNMYEKLGFILDQDLEPDYSYVDSKSGSVRRISKQKMRKKSINCPENISEREFCINLGFYRIWDCGKKRWKINL